MYTSRVMRGYVFLELLINIINTRIAGVNLDGDSLQKKIWLGFFFFSNGLWILIF